MGRVAVVAIHVLYCRPRIVNIAVITLDYGPCIGNIGGTTYGPRIGNIGGTTASCGAAHFAK